MRMFSAGVKEYDLAVIGGGPGGKLYLFINSIIKGYVAAIKAG